MRNILMVLAGGMVILSIGCASQTSFPTNGSQALKSESEFGKLTSQPDVFKGRAIRLAGRMVGVETTAEGTIVTAEWLPYPSNEYEGPTNTGLVNQGRFAVFYPGKLQSEGLLHGNKFLVIGKMEGTQSMMQVGGAFRPLPYIKARCLHIWKTGDADISTEPDVENTGYPVAEKTYCSKI